MPLSSKRKRPPGLDLETLVDVLKDRFSALIVCLSHSWGGLEQVVAADAMDLASLGLKVSVLCLEGSPIHDYISDKEGVKSIPLRFRPRNFFDFKLKNELKRLVQDGVTVIHCHQTSLLGSVTPWFWNRGDIVILASRHIMNDHDKRDPIHTAIYRRLDALIVMSQTLKDNVVATHSLKDRQVKVVHLGLDFDAFDPETVDPTVQRKTWGADEKTVVIGLVGRIDPAKGQETFIKAAAGLMKSLPPKDKIKFVIVGEETLGSTSDYLEELQKIVAQFRIEEHVVFAGYQENIPEVMSAFDIFVMPSRQEAFGLVAIEAMAMECPIIISSGGSANEIVGNEEFGLLMRPDDAFDLQRQIRFLLEHPELRVKMGKKGREHVRKNYDKSFRMRRNLEIYERCLRRRGL